MRASGRHARALSARTWALTLVVMVAALGLLLGITTTSLPYLVTSPTTDPHFGTLNHCLAAALEEMRLGWAVAPDASRAATFSAHAVALCQRDGRRAVFSTPGATAITFDGLGRLWVAAGERLLREEEGRLVPVGDFAPMILVGHAQGVLAQDESGQLLSISPQGDVLGQVWLPAGSSLSVGPEGLLAVAVVSGSLRAYEARTLLPIGAYAPCPVEGLWWLDTPERILITCGQGEAPALTLNLRTGEQSTALSRSRTQARRLSGRALYVHGCDGFPCTAPPP